MMDDPISRQAAIDAIDVLCQEHRYKIPGKIETYSTYNEAWQDALDRAEGMIFNLPSAQPERIRGRWNKISPAGIYECSVCGQNVMTDDIDVYHYCHGCGADMREDKLDALN